MRIGDALEVADLAAMLRDSLSGGTFVPSARTGAYTGPGVAVPSSVPQVAAFASESAAALAGGNGPAGVNGAGTDSPAPGSAWDGIAGSTSAGRTVAMPPPDRPSSPDYMSDEWNVPSRMSLPTRPSQADQPERPRRRAGALAIGAAAVASAGLIALLVSGVFSNPPAAKQPAGSSTQGPAADQTPSPSASRASHSSGSAGGATSPGGSATPGTPSSQSTHPGSKASASPGTPSPAGPSSSGVPSSSPTGGSSPSPTGSPSTAPSGTPTSPAGGSPAPSPAPSSCLLGICF